MSKRAITFCFYAGFLWQSMFAGAANGEQWGRLVHKENSLYHVIFVYRMDSVFTLRFGKQPAVQMQSQVDTSNLRLHRLEYTKMAFCTLLYKPEPKRVLVLGLGGGVIPREMHYYFPSAEIDVAEIDPAIAVIAEKYFGFVEDDLLKVHIADGRMFIKEQLREKTGKKYDIVILDAFNSDYIPFHLMTKEFLGEVKGVMAEDGVVVANVFSNNRLFDAEWATFNAVFGRSQVFIGNYTANAMLVSPGPQGQILSIDEAVSHANTLQNRLRPAFDMVTIARQLRPSIRPDPRTRVLTDDRAPVNRLREQKRRTE
jgi:spermidine synthase